MNTPRERGGWLWGDDLCVPAPHCLGWLPHLAALTGPLSLLHNGTEGGVRTHTQQEVRREEHCTALQEEPAQLALR